MSKQPEYLTVSELAKLLRVSNSHIYNLARSGKLASCSVGNSLRFNQNDIRDFVESGRRPNNDEEEARAVLRKFPIIREDYRSGNRDRMMIARRELCLELSRRKKKGEFSGDAYIVACKVLDKESL